jgi:methylmalonyl-CoA mutase
MAPDSGPALSEQWADLALGVLRKSGALGEDATPADAEARLSTRLPDGIAVRALYLDAGQAPDSGLPGQVPYLRGGTPASPFPAGWDVRQLHDDPDLTATRAAVLDDLEHGVRSVWLRLGPGAIPVGALEEVLADVILDAAPVVLEAGDAGDEVARRFLALAEARGIAAADLPGVLGLDPLGLEARSGVPHDLDAAAALAAGVAEGHPRVRTLVVDGLPYAEAGATDTEELGCAVATGVAYLRVLVEHGLTPSQAASQLEFRLAAGTDQFLTVAKFRAARRLWGRVTQVTGAVQAPRLHAVSSPAMLTRRDPWVNLLRVTVATFAAGVGGADAVTALPFDHALGYSDAFSRRIARNTAALLQDESDLGRVLDPGGGSWYLEQLSDQVAQTAWAWMQEIERAGGQHAALRDGLVADRLERSRAARYDRIRRRRDPITGVSTFPDLEATPVRRRPREVTPPAGLPTQRYAQPFEALRDRADAQLAATGVRPTAFLATLGPLARHNQRALFARNLLAAAGIDADPAGATSGTAEVVAAYRVRRHPVAILCGTAPDYAEQAIPLTEALKDEGARLVAVTGRPGVGEAAWSAAGVDRFLFEGGDALGDLEALLQALEPAGEGAARR